MYAAMQDKLAKSPAPLSKEHEDFLNNYLNEMVSQVTPKYMGRPFESDMGGTYGGPDNIYIRGTIPAEQSDRDRYFEYQKERYGNPFRGV